MQTDTETRPPIDALDAGVKTLLAALAAAGAWLVFQLFRAYLLSGWPVLPPTNTPIHDMLAQIIDTLWQVWGGGWPDAVYHKLCDPDTAAAIIAQHPGLDVFLAQLPLQLAFWAAFAGIPVAIRTCRRRPGRRHLSGPELTTDPRRLTERGQVQIHPDLTISPTRETTHILLIGSTGAGKSQVIWTLIESVLEIKQ